MKTGFQIEIQNDLTEHDYKLAVDFANEFISETCANGMKYFINTAAGYHSYLRRKRFGFLFSSGNELVFRRISSKKRIFGIVRTDTLSEMSGADVDLNRCMCPTHLGGMKVMWKAEKPVMDVYATIGDIKG